MEERGRSLRAIVAIAFSAAVLLEWLARAWYGRWIADDYCFATMAWRDGFWHGQALMYARLNGRISVSFLMAAITSLGRFTTPAAALVAMVLWIAGARLAVRRAFALVDCHASRIEELAGAILLVSAVISAAPDSDQPLIWLLGLMTYGVTVVCATWIAAMILGPATRHTAFAVAALAFVAGSCSEVAAAAQLIVFCTLIASVRRNRAMLVSGAAASAIALLILWLSPGNVIRRNLFTPLPFPDAFVRAVEATPRTTMMLLVEGLAPFALLVVFFLLAGERRAQARTLRTVAMLLTIPAVIAATLFGGLYGTGRIPWGRVQFIPVAYAAFALVFAALSSRRPQARIIAGSLTAAMAVLAVLSIAGSWSQQVETIREARRFAIAADDVDRHARQRRGTVLVVSAPREFELLEFLSPDPDHWTNRCMADYYGLTAIHTPLPSRR